MACSQTLIANVRERPLAGYIAKLYFCSGATCVPFPKKSTTIATRQHVDKRLDVVLLSPLSAQLLKLCDGERTVSEIANRLPVYSVTHPPGPDRATHSH